MVLRALEIWCGKYAKPIHVHSIEGLFNHSAGVGERVNLSILEKDNRVECKVSDSQNTLLLSLKFNWSNLFDKKYLNIDKLPQRKECAKYCNESLIAILLASTRIVGMDCPGLHSIYSSFNFKINHVHTSISENLINYKVTSSDERFSKLTISLENDFCTGNIDAFYRPKPYSQLSFKEVRKKLPNNNFEGQ